LAVRLQKYLAECGVASRRKCERLIEDGCVSINGRTATLGESISPHSDRVSVNGEPVGQPDKVYVLLNKPRDVVTSAFDRHHDRTVLDLIDGVNARIFPIGRLDKDVTGALLLTNDGELGHRLAHPSFEIDKVYNAWVGGAMREETRERLERGVELEDGRTAPAQVSILKTKRSATLIRLTIHEGKKRLVKRMCAAVGHPVQSLRRVSMAGLSCNGLMPGEWRYLTEEEVRRLYARTGLGNGLHDTKQQPEPIRKTDERP